MNMDEGIFVEAVPAISSSSRSSSPPSAASIPPVQQADNDPPLSVDQALRILNAEENEIYRNLKSLLAELTTCVSDVQTPLSGVYQLVAASPALLDTEIKFYKIYLVLDNENIWYKLRAPDTTIISEQLLEQQFTPKNWQLLKQHLLNEQLNLLDTEVQQELVQFFFSKDLLLGSLIEELEQLFNQSFEIAPLAQSSDGPSQKSMPSELTLDALIGKTKIYQLIAILELLTTNVDNLVKCQRKLNKQTRLDKITRNQNTHSAIISNHRQLVESSKEQLRQKKRFATALQRLQNNLNSVSKNAIIVEKEQSITNLSADLERERQNVAQLTLMIRSKNAELDTLTQDNKEETEQKQNKFIQEKEDLTVAHQQNLLQVTQAFEEKQRETQLQHEELLNKEKADWQLEKDALTLSLSNKEKELELNASKQPSDKTIALLKEEIELWKAHAKRSSEKIIEQQDKINELEAPKKTPSAGIKISKSQQPSQLERSGIAAKLAASLKALLDKHSLTDDPEAGPSNNNFNG